MRDPVTGEAAPTQLQSLLRPAIQRLVVVGLAGDYCVKETALDGVRLGYAVEVPLALTRFVELDEGDAERSVEQMRAAGVTVTRGRCSAGAAGSREGRLGGMTFPQDSADLAEGGRMPLLGFGTWQIKGARAGDAVGWALDAGYRHLDTATVYGNEKEVGAGLAASGVAARRRVPHHQVPAAQRRAASSTRCAPASTRSAPTTSTSG